MDRFILHSKYKPSGDQPRAIDELASGIQQGKSAQVLLGVTGSGKTFTMANVIERVQRPALVLAHNKTLAAQLCSEFKEYFPENAVEFFVSYYDYYQPEAYIASRDIYIEKDASVNSEIDRMRHSATSALLERRDVIVVASVSCIYGIGAPETYRDATATVRVGAEMDRSDFIDRLVAIGFVRNDYEFTRGTFRVRGDIVEVFPMSRSDRAIRVEFFGDEVDSIREVDALTGRPLFSTSYAMIFPATHYAMDRETVLSKLSEINADMLAQEKMFLNEKKFLEAERIVQRTRYDMEMLREVGTCTGVENYSRYFDGRSAGEPPYTLLDFFPEDFILFVDESHATLPQVRAMYNGDKARKDMLINYGFRLPAARDNRPLMFHEFESKIHQAVYVSATPAEYERELAGGEVVEQIVRPTGLLDPPIEIRPVANQLDDLLGEINKVTARKERVLVTTLTKKLAERLTDYYTELGVKVCYMHSDIETLERIEIVRKLRLGEYDVLVGINLLREGLDIPEITLVAILDADKEGFLRSETSLIQTIGRAARNSEGHVIMYADVMTDSMRLAIDETKRRRALQEAYNKEHGITPTTIKKAVRDLISISKEVAKTEEKMEKDPESMSREELEKLIGQVQKQMKAAAAELNFEMAAELRDKMITLKKSLDDMEE